MKKLLASIVFFALAAACPAQTAVDDLWNRANSAYLRNDYAAAAAIYDSIYSAGYSSHKLYYNLGNAYFKDGRTGKSILFYNRALLLKPADADTRYNLAVANTFVKDNIEAIPGFFLSEWMHSLRTSISPNAWAAISLLLIALLAAAVLVYLLSERVIMRKTGFYTGIVAFVLFVMSVSFSAIGRHEILHSPDAIIMSTAAPVKSSPDSESKDIFILHEGTKVRIISVLGQWREIEIADGNKGWIMDSSIETIH